VITVELVGGPADGYRAFAIDVMMVVAPPPAFGAPDARYRLREGQSVHASTALANRVLLYDYQPPEKAGA